MWAPAQHTGDFRTTFIFSPAQPSWLALLCSPARLNLSAAPTAERAKFHRCCAVLPCLRLEPKESLLSGSTSLPVSAAPAMHGTAASVPINSFLPHSLGCRSKDPALAPGKGSFPTSHQIPQNNNALRSQAACMRYVTNEAENETDLKECRWL